MNTLTGKRTLNHRQLLKKWILPPLPFDFRNDRHRVNLQCIKRRDNAKTSEDNAHRPPGLLLAEKRNINVPLTSLATIRSQKNSSAEMASLVPIILLILP
ncbi:hypothetical protein JTE90_011166 [Oedothorax gibbosus]|uniref:Uncharacterized protein n=1 Tax=Oedothorax gibbosus TaxID=931172 RepID=A0AAV6U9C9_9ARAC|nr:hypothetical protein JTE90_011166 [Oedothorax gibbosus]